MRLLTLQQDGAAIFASNRTPAPEPINFADNFALVKVGDLLHQRGKYIRLRDYADQAIVAIDAELSVRNAGTVTV